MKTLISEYKKKKYHIKKRLKEFENLRKRGNRDIFSELCFCILTPQTKAIYCNRAVEDLKKSGLLFRGDKDAISRRLRGTVRFHNNKSAYLVAARKLFSAEGPRLRREASEISPPASPAKRGEQSGGKNRRGLDVKSGLNKNDTLKTRDWLVKNIKGLGYKEASHFLRNIGLGKNIAIIDRHILENLRRYKVIDKVPTSISKRSYVSIEEKMRAFSQRVRIPLEELDLLFWSRQTGYIFK